MWSFVGNVAGGLDLGRELEVLLNGYTGRDAFVKNILLELFEGVLVGLGPQAFVLTEGDAVGEDRVDAAVHIGFVTTWLETKSMVSSWLVSPVASIILPGLYRLILASI